MGNNWATRYLFHLHTMAPLSFLGAYLLIGFSSWLVMIIDPPKQPKYMTHPQTAEEFAQRCRARVRANAYQEALKDCNRAIALDPSLPEAFRARSAVKNGLGDSQGGRADYWHARDLSIKPAPSQRQSKYTLNPQTAQEFLQRCRVHLRVNTYQEALQDCNQAIAQRPQFTRSIFRTQRRKESFGRLSG